MKRFMLYSLSRITNTNGRLTLNSGGKYRALLRTMPMLVAAAAVVPSSSTCMTDLCFTWVAEIKFQVRISNTDDDITQRRYTVRLNKTDDITQRRYTVRLIKTVDITKRRYRVRLIKTDDITKRR